MPMPISIIAPAASKMTLDSKVDKSNSSHFEFREGSETRFPKPKPDFASFWTDYTSFQTLKLGSVSGIGFQSLTETGQFQIVQLTRKKSHFCRALFVSLNKSVENSVLRSFIPVSDFSSFDNERLRRNNLNEQNIFLVKNIPKRP